MTHRKVRFRRTVVEETVISIRAESDEEALRTAQGMLDGYGLDDDEWGRAPYTGSYSKDECVVGIEPGPV